ncbi:MAG: HAMP domain-containing protein [Acidobacteriia bacterium]|nr:HAMP domain-containing protein [Terriglobia bacterium]
MIEDISIGKRLGYGAAIWIFLLLLTGITGYLGVRSVSREATHAVKESGRLAALAAQIKSTTLEMRRFEKDTYLNIDEPTVRAEYVAKWKTQRDKMHEKLNEISVLLTSEEEKQLFVKMHEDFSSYEQGYELVLSQIQDGSLKTPQECNQKINRYKSSIHELEYFAGKANENYESQMAQEIPVIDSLVDRTTGVIVALPLLALFGTIPFTVFFTRSITKPIRHVVDMAEEISNGNLSARIEGTGRKDELGVLSRSFVKMADYMKEMAGISAAIADGDLTVEVQPRSKDDVLSRAFADMTEDLRSMVTSVRDAASQVASGAGQVAQASAESAKMSVRGATSINDVSSTMHEMSANVQAVLRNMQAQAGSVSETSAAIDQMIKGIQRVAENVKKLLDICGRSGQEVESGMATMKRANQGLERINTSILSSAESIAVLGQRADDIGSIIEVIDDISEQTNLLALNAAIEAARAGEHGLGFAVVADEVRKLAEKSAQSTKEIGELIKNIQEEARKAVEDMEQNRSIVNEGMVLGSSLNDALLKIAQVVTELVKFSQEIGAATAEQSSGSMQISQATTRLNELTQEIRSAVEELAGGTQAVVKSMDGMQSIVQQGSSNATELSAAADQMAKMAGATLESMNRFTLETEPRNRESAQSERKRPKSRFTSGGRPEPAKTSRFDRQNPEYTAPVRG